MEFIVSIVKRKKPVTAGSFIQFVFPVIVIVAILTVPLKTFGQDRAIKIRPTAGITWRSTATEFFNLGGVAPADPTNGQKFDYERNVQGFSINPGLQITKNSLGFEYHPNLRYDVVHGVIGIPNKRVKEFIVDHNFNLFLRKKIDFGIGLTIVNTGKGYEYIHHNIPRYHNIEFTTYNVFVAIPIKKVVNLEIKALYINKGFPVNPNEECIMFSLRAYYMFDFLNKKKK